MTAKVVSFRRSAPVRSDVYSSCNARGLDAHMTVGRVSNTKLGVLANCDPSMVSRLRTGQRPTCSPELAARIERALGVRPGELFELRVQSKSA
jgi:hypothetical protein